jgi:hypothetical protein
VIVTALDHFPHLLYAGGLYFVIVLRELEKQQYGRSRLQTLRLYTKIKIIIAIK